MAPESHALALGPQMEELLEKVVEPAEGGASLKEVGHRVGFALPLCSLLPDYTTDRVHCLWSSRGHFSSSGWVCRTDPDPTPFNLLLPQSLSSLLW